MRPKLIIHGKEIEGIETEIKVLGNKMVGLRIVFPSFCKDDSIRGTHRILKPDTATIEVVTEMTSKQFKELLDEFGMKDSKTPKGGYKKMEK